MQDALVLYALRQAQASFAAAKWAEALDWLASVPRAMQPMDDVARANGCLAREAIARGAWGLAEAHLERALAIRRDPCLERRLHLVRHTAPLLDDQQWTFLRSKIDPAAALAPGRLQPEINGTYTCGAYHSRRDRGLPWSRFLRIAKDAPRDTEDGAAALRLAGEFLCRTVYAETPLLGQVDVVVAVPSSPAHYANRMMSLPDELARALESHFALPFLFDALLSDAPDDLELRRLSWSERRRMVRGTMRAGDIGIAAGRAVLLVDDITTSGATLKEAARTLRAAGAADVFAITLSHTEG